MRHFFIALAALPLLAACAKDINPNTYAEQQVGEVSETYEGVIQSLRVVKVTEGDSSGTGAGTLLGGVTGGIAGAQFGDGAGAVAATAGGAILGGLLGAATETQLKKQTGVEYTVKLSNGSLKTVVQGAEPPLRTGQAVYLVVSQGGRSRLTAK